MRITTDDIEVPDGSPDWVRSIVRLLSAYRLGIYLAILCLTALVVTGRASIPSVPPWIETMLLGIGVGIIPSMVLGKVLIVDKFLPDRRLKVLVIDVPDLDGDSINTQSLDVDGKRVSRGLWSDRIKGKWPAWSPPGSIDKVVTAFEYDSEEHTLRIEGVAEDIANPADIVARDGKLDEVYHNLLDSRHELSRMQATMSSKTLDIEANNVMALIESVEHSAQFDGTDALDVIQSEQWDREIRAEDREDPDEEIEDDGDSETLSDLLAAANKPSGQQEAQADD